MYKNHNCEVVLAGVNPDPDNLQDGVYGTDKIYYSNIIRHIIFLMVYTCSS